MRPRAAETEKAASTAPEVQPVETTAAGPPAAATEPVPPPPPPAAKQAEPKPQEARRSARALAVLKRLRGNAAEARLRAVGAGVSADALARGDASLARADSLGRSDRVAEAAAELSTAAATWNDAADEAHERQAAVPPPPPAETAAVVVPKPAPAAVAPPPPAAPAPAADPRPQILAVIQQYSAAIESRNVDAIKRVYPGMLPRQALDWEQFFQAVDDIDVQLDVTGLDVAGNAAQAQLSGVYNFTDPGTRRPRHENVSFIAALQRDGGKWSIQSVR